MQSPTNNGKVLARSHRDWATMSRRKPAKDSEPPIRESHFQALPGRSHPKVYGFIIMNLVSSLLLVAWALLLFPLAFALENGDQVCVEGFIMDNFCIDLGVLLDNNSVQTLRNPERHSVHCLVDVYICYSSGYAVLNDKAPGEALHTVGWALDADGTADLRELAQNHGSTQGTCSTCTGKDGNIEAGFRAGIRGVVVDATAVPPVIRVVSAQYVSVNDRFCPLPTASPTAIANPTAAVTASPIATPTVTLTEAPAVVVTAIPTSQTGAPSVSQTAVPTSQTASPTQSPVTISTPFPSLSLSPAATQEPTPLETQDPTPLETQDPTPLETQEPTPLETQDPTVSSTTLAPAPPVAPSVVDVVEEHEELSLLEGAIVASGLYESLLGDGPTTVLAPNDDAFVNANKDGLVDKLLTPEWKAHLEHLLKFHFMAGMVLAENITDDSVISTWIPETITASVDGNVSFSGASFQNSSVVEANLTADNGVVHVVDAVFIPTALVTDIFATVEGSGLHSNLLTLLAETDLEDTLREENVTIFAPTNTAFDDIDPEYFGTIAMDSDLIAELLLKHVVPGVWPREMLMDGLNLTSLGNETLIISVDNVTGSITIDDALLGSTQLGSNGILYSIDQFLIDPPTPVPTTVAPIASPTNSPVAAIGSANPTPLPVEAPDVIVTTPTGTPELEPTSGSVSMTRLWIGLLVAGTSSLLFYY